MLPRTWRRRTGGQLKTWITTLKANLEPRVFGYARRKKDWVKVSSELTQDHRAWSASIRDVVTSVVSDDGSTRPRGMPTQVKVGSKVMTYTSPL